MERKGLDQSGIKARRQTGQTLLCLWLLGGVKHLHLFSLPHNEYKMMAVQSHDASLDLALADFYALYGDCDDSEDTMEGAPKQQGTHNVQKSKRKKKSDFHRGKQQPSRSVEPDLNVVPSLCRKERKQVQAPARAVSSRLLRQAQDKKLNSTRVLQSVRPPEPKHDNTHAEAKGLVFDDDVAKDQGAAPQLMMSSAAGCPQTQLKQLKSSRKSKTSSDKPIETKDILAGVPASREVRKEEGKSPLEPRNRSPRHLRRWKEDPLANKQSLESKRSPKRDLSHRGQQSKSQHSSKPPSTSCLSASKCGKSRRKHRSTSPASRSRRNVLSAKPNGQATKIISDSNRSPLLETKLRQTWCLGGQPSMKDGIPSFPSGSLKSGACQGMKEDNSVSPGRNKEAELLSVCPQQAIDIAISPKTNLCSIPSTENCSSIGPELTMPKCHPPSLPVPQRQRSLLEEISSSPLPQCRLGRQRSLPEDINASQNSPKSHQVPFEYGRSEPHEVSPNTRSTQSANGRRSKMSSRGIERSQSERRNRSPRRRIRSHYQSCRPTSPREIGK